MKNDTERPCFDFADTPQYMLEFIEDDRNSFSFTYSYMLCWELIDNSTLIFKFMSEEVRVEGKSLHHLKGYISKHQLCFLRKNSTVTKKENNLKGPIITLITKNQDSH